jgi:hypothetical protein
MSYGFEVYNDAGALQIDSDNKTTLFSDIRNIDGLTDNGYYKIDNPFGGNTRLVFKASRHATPGYLYWFRLNAGASYAWRLELSERTAVKSSGQLETLALRADILM